MMPRQQDVQDRYFKENPEVLKALQGAVKQVPQDPQELEEWDTDTLEIELDVPVEPTTSNGNIIVRSQSGELWYVTALRYNCGRHEAVLGRTPESRDVVYDVKALTLIF